MKAAINIKPGGSMTDPSGTLVTWSPSNSVRVSHECYEVSEALVLQVAQEVAKHASLLRDLDDPDMKYSLQDFYLINVSISQPRPDSNSTNEVSAQLDTSAVESFEDEDSDEGENEESTEG